MPLTPEAPMPNRELRTANPSPPQLPFRPIEVPFQARILPLILDQGGQNFHAGFEIPRCPSRISLRLQNSPEPAMDDR